MASPAVRVCAPAFPGVLRAGNSPDLRRGCTRETVSAHSAAPGSPLFAHPHVDADRRPLEPEGLAQPPLQEAAVPGLQKTGGEQNERRGPGGRLGGEQDAWLLAATHR